MKHGPEDFKTGLPMWVEWNGQKYYTPQFRQIQDWIHDGPWLTLDGQRLEEPDAYGANGCPSWLRALELI